MADCPEKRDILRRSQELRHWDYEERLRILADHMEEFYARRRKLQAECEAAGGHDMRLDEGELARPHFLTGEWPTHCIWCKLEGSTGDKNYKEAGTGYRNSSGEADGRDDSSGTKQGEFNRESDRPVPRICRPINVRRIGRRNDKPGDK